MLPLWTHPTVLPHGWHADCVFLLPHTRACSAGKIITAVVSHIVSIFYVLNKEPFWNEAENDHITLLVSRQWRNHTQKKADCNLVAVEDKRLYHKAAGVKYIFLKHKHVAPVPLLISTNNYNIQQTIILRELLNSNTRQILLFTLTDMIQSQEKKPLTWPV